MRVGEKPADGEVGSEASEVTYRSGIAGDERGSVYVADMYDNGIKTVMSDGTFVSR